MQSLPLAVVSCPPQNQDQHPSGRSIKSLTLKWKVLSSSKSVCSGSTPVARTLPGWPWHFWFLMCSHTCKAELSQFSQKRKGRQAALLQGMRKTSPQGGGDIWGTCAQGRAQSSGPRQMSFLCTLPVAQNPRPFLPHGGWQGYTITWSMSAWVWPVHKALPCIQFHWASQPPRS